MLLSPVFGIIVDKIGKRVLLGIKKEEEEEEEEENKKKNKKKKNKKK
jgi:hypothetical protein